MRLKYYWISHVKAKLKFSGNKLKLPETFGKKITSILKVKQSQYHKLMHPKDADGMAKSVGPDKTDLILHCLPRTVWKTCLSERISTIALKLFAFLI